MCVFLLTLDTLLPISSCTIAAAIKDCDNPVRREQGKNDSIYHTISESEPSGLPDIPSGGKNPYLLEKPFQKTILKPREFIPD
ncbi:MAG: hypothetical protein JXA44_01580 [Methanospirillaceae archaeon]|nr:hypothetical protein [Methanospirillaceae archaeon]